MVVTFVKLSAYAHQGGHSASLALLSCCLREHSRIRLPILSDQECMHLLPVTCMLVQCVSWCPIRQLYIHLSPVIFYMILYIYMYLISKPCLCCLVLRFIIEVVLTLQGTYTYSCTFCTYQYISVAYSNKHLSSQRNLHSVQ